MPGMGSAIGGVSALAKGACHAAATGEACNVSGRYEPIGSAVPTQTTVRKGQVFPSHEGVGVEWGLIKATNPSERDESRRKECLDLG